MSWDNTDTFFRKKVYLSLIEPFNVKTNDGDCHGFLEVPGSDSGRGSV